MMQALLVRKLLFYVAYSAAVTALPVLATVPKDWITPPSLRAAACPSEGDTCRLDCPCVVNRPVAAAALHRPPSPANAPALSYPNADRWWCRGPVRRCVRGIALFISRPWRR